MQPGFYSTDSTDVEVQPGTDPSVCKVIVGWYQRIDLFPSNNS